MGKTVSDKAALSTKGAKFFKDVAALESRIAELEREVAFWKADASAARDIEQAVHKDAERYRKLREYGCWLDPNKYAKAGHVLDDAVDAFDA